jgi:HD-GYP domain-containing protein (c-di-GMP phosphodiesterase class II)
VALATLAPWNRPLSPVAVTVTAIAYLAAARVTFPVGSAWTRPTQLAFVPMLFLLPTALVPLAVAACLVADLSPHLVRRTLSRTLLLTRIADSFYALGPALVLVLSGQDGFSWERWPLLVLAFAAQLLFDTGGGLARTWFAERIAPSEQLPMLWLYLTDACLSCVGLLVAASALRRPGLVLLVLPLVGLLWLFAREREQRIDNELALSTAYRGTALLLGDVVELDDHYTGAHSRDVVDLAVAVADALGLDAATRRNVEFAALLHDVGKLRVPKSIINKAGALTDAEWEIVRRHTIEGETMLTQVGGVLATVGHYVRSSHERYDGTGYPDGLAAEEIPIESRIVCACDAYSAMTTDRPYRPALRFGEAIAELHRCAGTHFDPRIVAAIDQLTRVREPFRPRMGIKNPFSRHSDSALESSADHRPAVPV